MLNTATASWGWRSRARQNGCRNDNSRILTHRPTIPRFDRHFEATDAAHAAQYSAASAGPERAVQPLARNLPADHGHLLRDRGAGRLAHAVAQAWPALAGHHPQRNGGSGGAGPAVRAAHLGGAAAHGTWTAAV